MSKNLLRYSHETTLSKNMKCTAFIFFFPCFDLRDSKLIILKNSFYGFYRNIISDYMFWLTENIFTTNISI